MLIWRHLSSSQMRFFFPKFKSNNSTIFGCLIVLRETYQQKLLFILYYPLKPSILASPFLIHPQTWSTLQDPQRFNCDDSKRAICPWGSSSCPKVCASWAWKKWPTYETVPKIRGKVDPVSATIWCLSSQGPKYSGVPEGNPVGGRSNLWCAHDCRMGGTSILSETYGGHSQSSDANPGNQVAEKLDQPCPI